MLTNNTMEYDKITINTVESGALSGLHSAIIASAANSTEVALTPLSTTPTGKTSVQSICPNVVTRQLLTV